METTIAKMRNYIVTKYPARSKWQRAVKADALDFIDFLENSVPDWEARIEKGEILNDILLNGAVSWSEYSWDGCALICNEDIRERYLTDSAQKKWKGEYIKGLHLLDIQARALSRARISVAMAWAQVTKK